MWHIACDIAILSCWHFTSKDHLSRTIRYDLMLTFSMRNPSGSTYSAPAPFDDDARQMFFARLSPAGLKLHKASEVRELRSLAIASSSNVCNPLHSSQSFMRESLKKNATAAHLLEETL